MLLPTNLVKPVTLQLHWSTAYVLWQKFQKGLDGGELIQKKQFLFIPFDLINRHWTLLFVNLKPKTLYILGLLTQHTNGDLANKAPSQISFLRKNVVTQKDLQLEVCRIFYKTMLLSCGIFSCYYALQIVKGTFFFLLKVH